MIANEDYLYIAKKNFSKNFDQFSRSSSEDNKHEDTDDNDSVITLTPEKAPRRSKLNDSPSAKVGFSEEEEGKAYD